MDVSYSKWGEVLSLHVLKKTSGVQVGRRVPRSPQKGDVISGEGKGFFPCRSSRCQPVVRDCLAGRSHESDSVIAKQSNRKGCWV